MAVLSGLFAVSALAQDPSLTGPPEVKPHGTPVAEITRLNTRIVNFTWNRGGLNNDQIVRFRLFVGSVLAFGDVGDVTVPSVKDQNNYSAQVSVPTDGRQVFVRLHWTVRENNIEVIKWADYVYLAANQHYIVSPVPGTTLALSSADGCLIPPQITFQWEVVAALGQPDRWWFYLGTAADPDQFSNIGPIAADQRQITVSNIPTNGQPVIATLWYQKGTEAWQKNEFGYNTPRLPAIVAPANSGASLPGTNGDLVLDPNGSRVQFFWVYAGTAANPLLYHSAGFEVPAEERAVTQQLASFQNFPDDGSNVLVTLFWRLEGEGPDKWKCRQYTYKASTGPVVTSPVKGGDNPQRLPTDLSIPTLSQTVTWDNKGTQAQQWQVVLNESGDPADNGLFRTGLLGAPVREAAIPNSVFTTDGRTVYIILRYWVSGGLAENLFTDAVVCAFRTRNIPYLTAPSSISKCFTNFLGNEATFSWVDGGFTFGNPPQSPLGWWLYAGASQGSREYHNSGALAPSVLSRTLTNLPTNGEPLWIRLWWLVEERTTTQNPDPSAGDETVVTTTRRWMPRDFRFTNPRCPEITNPNYGATIVGSQKVVVIDKRGVNVNGLWITVSSLAPTGGDAKNPNPNTANIDNSNLLIPGTESHTIRNLPIDGSAVYVTLWWLPSTTAVSSWQFRTFRYISSATVPTPSLLVPDPTKPNDVNSTDLVFRWRSNNTVVFGWWLYVANTVTANNAGGGPDGFNVHNSGFIQPQEAGTVYEQSVTGLPCGTFYVTLWYLDEGLNWNKIQYTFSNKAGCGGGGGGGPAGPGGEQS